MHVREGTYPIVDDPEHLTTMNEADRCGLINSISIQLTGSPQISAIATAILRICRSLPDIFAGAIKPLEMPLKDGILTRTYDFTAGIYTS